MCWLCLTCSAVPLNILGSPLQSIPPPRLQTKPYMHFSSHSPHTQLDAFREGFNEVFPLRSLECFYEDEVEMLLCGAGAAGGFLFLSVRFLFLGLAVGCGRGMCGRCVIGSHALLLHIPCVVGSMCLRISWLGMGGACVALCSAAVDRSLCPAYLVHLLAMKRYTTARTQACECVLHHSLSCFMARPVCCAGEHWTVQSLAEAIKFDHGYTVASPVGRALLEVLPHSCTADPCTALALYCLAFVLHSAHPCTVSPMYCLTLVPRPHALHHPCTASSLDYTPCTASTLNCALNCAPHLSQVLAELEPTDQRRFLRFVTGAPPATHCPLSCSLPAACGLRLPRFLFLIRAEPGAPSVLTCA